MDGRGEKERQGKREEKSVGSEGIASASGRCCRRVKKGIEEERDRMREKEGGGERGFGWEGRRL